MLASRKPGVWRSWVILAAGLLAVCLLHPLSPASAKTWNTGSDDWDSYFAWSPWGQPDDGDSVYLTKDNATNTVVAFKTGNPTAVYNLGDYPFHKVRSNLRMR